MTTLSLFDDPDDDTPKQLAAPEPMSEFQRTEIRRLFGNLDLSTAREQFDLVEVLVGIRLRIVTDLTASDAQQLILRLRGRVANQSRSSTGNSWADREEDTWIDRL